MSSSALISFERVHLCLIEPPSYPHSGALLDPLVFFQDQFARCGAEVTAAKNELRADAVNYVFGAHLGFDPSLLADFRCVLVNLEQLGAGGAQLPPAYVALLSHAQVVDYHSDNRSAYDAGLGRCSQVRLGYAEYLDLPTIPIEDRDVSLLFLGSMTPRRLDILRAIEKAGQPVSVVDRPVYGPDRDALVRRARAVLNVGAYETNRFEQVRASVVLSCGTPLVSERRRPSSSADSRFIPFVHWFEPGHALEFFNGPFLAADYCEKSRQMLTEWRETRVVEDYAHLLASHSRMFSRSSSSTPPLFGSSAPGYAR